MVAEELFKNNIKIAYKVFSNYAKTITKNHRDDIEQEALLGLWKAATTFKEENKIAFSTYAYAVINNQILMYLRALKKHKQTISLYEEIGDNICILDTIAEDTNCFEDLEDMECVKEILKIMQKYDDKSMKALKLRIQGKRQQEIANILGISQTYVSRLITKAIKKIQETTKEEDKCN